MNNCSGCIPNDREGTHQLGTIEHPETTTPNPTNMEDTTWEEDWRPQFYNRWYRGNEQHPHVMFAHHTMEDMLKDIEGIVKQAEQRGERKGREKLSWELIHTVGAVIPMSGESANNPEILARDIKEILDEALTPHNGEE